MLPNLKNVKTQTHMISAFKGLCAREHIPEGYFARVMNTSSRLYPALTPRTRRGLAYQCMDIRGFHAHDKMCWAQWGDLFYDSELMGEVSMTRKQFASLGAYIAVFPDKLLLNTDTRELTRMENTVIVEGATASISDALGESATSSSYTKIAAAGIGAGFKKGDQVSVTGFVYEPLNQSFILQAVDEDYVVVLHSLDANQAQTGTVTLTRTVPDMDYVCAINNRIWGCSSAKHEIYACKLGDPTNWHVYEGIATDSYTATVATSGDFTGACTYAGTVLFFKEDEIIKLFGTKPSNFQLVSAKSRGIQKGSARSAKVVNEVLYYLGTDGVMSYDGSSPGLISAALGATRFDSACAGALGGKYYICMRDADKNTWALYVYDAELGTWNVEDCERAICMETYNNNLYIACADDSVINVSGFESWFDESALDMPYQMGQEMLVTWSAESGAIKLSTPGKKTVTKLQIRFTAQQGAYFYVDLRYSPNGEWERAAEFRYTQGANTVAIPLVPHRADSVYIKLSGYGDTIVNSIAKTIETGSEL